MCATTRKDTAGGLPITLDEKHVLERWAKTGTVSRALARRAAIVLSSASGVTNTRVADELGVSRATVGKWRNRFIDQGPMGLLDAPRPGAPPLQDETERSVIDELRRSPSPPTTRAIAIRTGVSQTTVSRILRSLVLDPREPLSCFTELKRTRIAHVAGFFLDPPHRALALQGFTRVNGSRPHRRPRAAELLGAVERKSTAFSAGRERRERWAAYAKFLRRLERELRHAPIHLLVDSYTSQTSRGVRCWLERRPHCRVHSAPTSQSWGQLVARWLEELETRDGHLLELEASLRLFVRSRRCGTPFSWIASGD